MTASPPSARIITLPRIAILALILVAIFFFRDTFLPTESPYRSHSTSPAHLHTQPDQASHYESESTTQDKSSSSSSSSSTTPSVHYATNTSASDEPESCLSVPGADNVLIMLKTGATELYQKLPTHFMTTFTCVPHFMIFSDLAQNFADIPIHDAIAPISSHFRDHHEDFELYRKLQQYQREGQNLHALSGSGGWNLDKWKFLPMLHQAFESAPAHIEWFLLMEADTSISWTNLLQWLRTMDPTKPYYLGAQNVIGSTTFAHGGSGVVISRRAADLLETKRRSLGQTTYDAVWEETTSTSCCGDEIVARAFLDVDVPLTPAWPLIQGETVSSIDWKPDHWCTVALTWHHVTPIEIDSLFQFETSWIANHGWETPYLYRDVFEHFIDRHISVNRTAWKNLSKDHRFVRPDLLALPSQMREEPPTTPFEQLRPYEQAAVESQDACAEACRRHRKCVQWMFAPEGRCYLGDVVRFGGSDEQREGGAGGGRGGQEAGPWVSGWMQERVQRFKSGFEGCEVRWHG
ncbi:glycosyltransferase family 31 protein [Hortaea werneckii]|nr:glycosyltransferase family 31 protein [Hortaea werneckii]